MEGNSEQEGGRLERKDRFMANQERVNRLIEGAARGELSSDEVAKKIGLLITKLETQIGTDPLTGVLNRQGIKKQLGQEIAHARRGRTPLAVLMLDLDSFGAINKERGLREGDQAIKVMADFLRRSVVHRETDSLGRLGGDEFIIICPFTNQEGAAKLAEEIRGSLPECMHEAGFDFTVSVGVSSMREDNQNVKVLLHEADSAQMAAKKNGKNRVEEYPVKS